MVYISTPITQQQAAAALETLKKQFARYLAPVELAGGVTLPGAEPPELVERFDDQPHWAIVWNDGPTDWVVAAFAGGRDDDAYQQMLTMHMDRDRAKATAAIAGVESPDGVFAEPIRDNVLGLYPDVTVTVR